MALFSPAYGGRKQYESLFTKPSVLTRPHRKRIMKDTIWTHFGATRGQEAYMNPILIVEDEKAIADLLGMTLETAGYRCQIAPDGMAAADLIAERDFDLVLLDIMLPYIDGYELIEYIAPLNIPVIFLTAKSDVVDRVKGLRMGADDYIVKPFEPMELLARVESVLRRYNKDNRMLGAWDVVLDPVDHRVMKAGDEVFLTPREFDLLLLLLRNRGATLYRDYLYEVVWDGDFVDTRTLDTHIQRLRRKLDWKDKIKSIYKVGYRLEGDA
jgi:DNA-binding response OmpR family regulator